MKLFQQMLVAGASLSLLTPVVAQASDISIEEMNDYVRSSKSSKKFNSKTFINEVSDEIANLNGPVDGLEVQQNGLEAGSFSDTTTLDGSAVFAATAIDGATKVNSSATENLQTMYTYTCLLYTSPSPRDTILSRMPSSA